MPGLRNSCKACSAKQLAGCVFRREWPRLEAFLRSSLHLPTPPMLDVTGTVAGLAALTGTLYAVFRRRKTLREYRERMNEKRKDLATAVETQLKNAIAVFYQEVAQTFSPLESFCEAEARRHLPMKERIDQLDRTLFAIKEQVG